MKTPARSSSLRQEYTGTNTLTLEGPETADALLLQIPFTRYGEGKMLDKMLPRSANPLEPLLVAVEEATKPLVDWTHNSG